MTAPPPSGGPAAQRETFILFVCHTL